jgi:hypothetical protein
VAESFVNVTEGSGKKLWTADKTVGANLVQAQKTLPAEFDYASYTVTTAGGVALATANSHLLQIMAGSSLNVRIRSIRLSGFAVPAAVTAMEIDIFRLSTAGTGGTAITPRPYDTADAAAGATAMTLPTAKGTEGVLVYAQGVIWGTAALLSQKPEFVWTQQPNTKPLLIAAGTSNGIAIKNITGVATATAIVTVEFVETNFV